MGISQAGTENIVPFFQMGPLCVHKSTNSLSANGVLLAGQLCASVSVSEKIIERLLVAETDRKKKNPRPDNIAMLSYHSSSFNEKVVFLTSSTWFLLC